MRYKMGPPYRPRTPSEAAVTGFEPSHRRENKLTETKAARNWVNLLAAMRENLL